MIWILQLQILLGTAGRREYLFIYLGPFILTALHTPDFFFFQFDTTVCKHALVYIFG
jgi:hypothetical protein